MSGVFITFEGGDGVGKSTQLQLLAGFVESLGREVIVTREPGGTVLGAEIRNIVLHHRGEIAPRAEALLYAADRAHHVETVVRPALERGAVVIQDRYFDSSIAYQGAGRVLDGEEVREISMWATGSLIPDLTVLLDLDAQQARVRLDAEAKEFDRLESEQSDFHERVQRAYRDLALLDPARWLVLDASQTIDNIAKTIRERVEPMVSDPR